MSGIVELVVIEFHKNSHKSKAFKMSPENILVCVIMKIAWIDNPKQIEEKTT